MPRRGRIAGLALLLLAGSAPAAAEDAADISAPGTSVKIVLDERAGGFRRSFRLHVPVGADDEPRPLVVAIHGGFSSAHAHERQTAFSALADRAGFYVAYPNGLGIFSLARHWNGGFCCGKARAEDLDDPGFIDRVIEWTEARHAIDRRRIYVVGFSNGGFLAYWYAALRADRLAGLGIWASSIGSLDTPKKSWAWSPPATPLPAFIAHGQADPRLPWETGRARGNVKLLGAVASAEAWAEANGCGEAPVESRSHGGAVVRRSWCAGGPSPVVLLGLEGWGHEWPGPRRMDKLDVAPEARKRNVAPEARQRNPSEPLREFHLAEEMWSFFDRDPVARE